MRQGRRNRHRFHGNNPNNPNAERGNSNSSNRDGNRGDANGNVGGNGNGGDPYEPQPESNENPAYAMPVAAAEGEDGTVVAAVQAPRQPAPQMSDDPGEDGSGAAGSAQQPLEPPKVVHVPDLKKKTASELLEMATEQGLDNISRAKKQDVIFQMLKAAARRGEHIYTEGVLEIMPDGYGFLRGPDSSYSAGPDDVYISPSQIRRFALRTGDTIAGRVRSPKDNERYFALLKVDTINFEPYEQSRKKVSFENLTPLFADERFIM